MNNAGSQLLTIADMSVIEAEVEVDETDIPFVALGQQAKVMIDAVEDRTFKGHVTEIGNSPIQANSQGGGQRQATTFKVVITLDEEVPNIRPGFTCTAEITTSKKQNVTSVPIQALTVRELLFDHSGHRSSAEDTTDKRKRRSARRQQVVGRAASRPHAKRNGRRLPGARPKSRLSQHRQDRNCRGKVL
jgi:HlyD family secretion protein